jgi:predicted nucleotidyltransferase component of viral defense system
VLDIQKIKQAYPENLHIFERSLLREYLQYKILQALFESKQASKIAFLGGTALRIVHGNSRFSEDIDVDNFGLSWSEFEEAIQRVQRFMELEGFEVEVRNVAKGAYRCYLRFPTLLYGQGLSPFQEEKILVQVDTAAQGYGYEPDLRILNRFDVFAEIRVTPLDVLFAQKIYTAVNRQSPKGRDFYDITYLAGRTKPDYGYLKLKLGISTAEELRGEISDKIGTLNFKKLASDVAPFLINADQVKRVELFREFWQQVDLG